MVSVTTAVKFVGEKNGRLAGTSSGCQDFARVRGDCQKFASECEKTALKMAQVEKKVSAGRPSTLPASCRSWNAWSAINLAEKVRAGDDPEDFGSEKSECCDPSIFTLEELKWEEPFSSGVSSCANSARRVSWAARNWNGTGRKDLSGPSSMFPRKEKMDSHSSHLN